MEPEPPFLPGAGAEPIWSEPESAPAPRTAKAGAAQKSGGSATLHLTPTKKFFIRFLVGRRLIISAHLESFFFLLKLTGKPC